MLSVSCNLSCSARLSVWLRPRRSQHNAASSLALYEQWCLLHLQWCLQHLQWCVLHFQWSVLHWQTVSRDACRVSCNAHSCSTGFLLDQVMTADCCTLGESFVAVLVESVPAHSMILAKPACACRVWISPIYIPEIACICIFCRQTYCTAMVVVQGMTESRGRAAIKAGNINDLASNPEKKQLCKYREVLAFMKSTPSIITRKQSIITRKWYCWSSTCIADKDHISCITCKIHRLFLDNILISTVCPGTPGMSAQGLSFYQIFHHFDFPSFCFAALGFSCTDWRPPGTSGDSRRSQNCYSFKFSSMA